MCGHVGIGIVCRGARHIRQGLAATDQAHLNFVLFHVIVLFVRERRWVVKSTVSSVAGSQEENERTCVIVLDKTRKLLFLFVFGECFGIDVSLLDEPCAEFLWKAKGC